jgi:hypothetical protein
MPSHRGHQKRLEKKKKQRLAARSAEQRSSSSPSSLNGIMRLASSAPFGPAFMSASWRSVAFELVSVVVTRTLPDGTMVVGVALVDRTCLGVKNAFARHLQSRLELDDLLNAVGASHQKGLDEVETLEAQSVVFHAIDYASSLGFSPQRDFPELVFGPRPETLIETPLARPTEPVFIPGPSDDVPRILRTIEASKLLPAHG